MTQTNDTNSRITRLEALMLEIAASNLRHDRTNDRQDDAIARHEQWQTEERERQQRHQERMEEWQRQQEAAIADKMKFSIALMPNKPSTNSNSTN
ncbi:MAG: hypothetical protein HC881_03655 [Leptolyngbyaceae cyanobacterium SL_7_1]|nr:hypothetical protein [Leptolyngbyaceae cyanobacterium SL_7_1]